MRSLLLASCIFALAYTQSPYGFSNQNQYLLHGVAQSGASNLDADWLANTKDPTPLFSGYIAIISRSGYHTQIVWLSYFAVLVLFVFSIAKLLEKLPGVPTTRGGRRFAFALLLVTHAAIWRLLSVKLLGVDYPWYFQAGFASQYILGAGFQPSVFGVLLIASLAAFLYERLTLSVALAVFACAMHFTYLLPTTLLACGYLVATARSEGRGAALRLASLFLVGLVPVVAFNAIRFQPTDATTFAEAQRLLAEVRIPHHALVSRWLDPIAGLQMAWILLGIWLVRRTPLGIVLLVATIIAAILTVIAAVTGYHLLCLLFPWRISAVMVPLATAIIACRVSRWVDLSHFTLGGEGRSLSPSPLGGEGRGGGLAIATTSANSPLPNPPQRGRGTWLSAVATIIIAVSLAAGVVHPFSTFGYATNDESERDLYEAVNRFGQRGNVYLIPTRIPPLNSGKRGAASTTFTAPPRPSSGSNLIPVDLQRFRMMSGRPIFVDFKSVPYADVEVREWHRRVTVASSWYVANAWNTSEVRQSLQREGISHVVVPASVAIDTDGFVLEHRDSNFRIYRIE